VSRLAVLLALAGLALATPRARAADPPPDGPPLNLTADNLTGSHGPEGDFVMLNGAVRMTRGRTVLTADAGRYYKVQGMLYLDGRVRMVDSVTTMTCDHASYSEDQDLLFVQGNVKLVDKDSEIRAPSGTYDRRSGHADLAGPVEGRDRKMVLFADRAVYMRDSAIVLAREHVRGVDQENKSELEARSVDYDRVRKVAVGTGDPVLRSRGDDGRITELRALRLVVDTGKRVAEAIDSVRISRDTLQARGDHALFDDVAQRGWVTGSPRAWDDQTTVSGDTLEFHTEKRAIQAIVVRHDAVMNYVGSRPTTLGEASRLTGDTATVYFTRGEIDSLVAVGRARNQYTGVARAGKTSEQNEASGDTITVFFRERKIDRAQVQGGARGTYRIAVDEGDTTAAKREVVEYDARRIEFRVAESTIVLDQEAHLTYQDLELRAREVNYDIERQTVEAEGSPVLGDRGEQVKGGLMTYDLPSRVGTIYDAQTNYEKGLYLGQRIRKMNENELDVMNGTYTTCNEAKAHYHFSSRWMKIFLKDKLVAKPVMFYLGNVPLLALPFWVFPVKSGRRSGVLFPQFEFGFGNSTGQFIRNAGYYWAPNDYMGFTAAGDYYQAEPSWVLRGEGEYRLLYRLDGSFRGTFARSEGPRNRTENWDFSADHSQEITPRTRLVARASFVSSKAYNSSNLYGRSLSQRLNRFLTSSLAVSHNADWASINAVIDRRQDLDADEGLTETNHNFIQPIGTTTTLANLTETSPSLSISFPTRAIGSLGLLKRTPLAKPLRTLYFGLNSQFISYAERRAFVAGHTPFAADSTRDSITTLGQRRTTRRGLSNSISLSDSRQLFGWLNFQPQLRSNVVVFDFDEQGNKVVPAGVWSSAVTMSATFYGSFRPRIFGLEGLRHVVSPSASLSYSPDFPGLFYVDSRGVRQSRFRSFSGVGISGSQRSNLNFSLDQRLQAKLKRGGNVTRLDNLLSWGVGGSYDFLYRDHGLEHPLSNLSSGVLLQPPSYMNANLSWVTDVYNPHPVRSLGYNLGLNLDSGGLGHTSPDLPVEPQSEAGPREDWSFGFAYSYSGGYSTGFSTDPKWASTKTANLTGRYQLSPAWAFEYAASLDLTLHTVQTQRFVLTRDLHCWQAVFTRSFVVGGEAEYYFRIGVKDQKEIYLERGTRVGSLGGIQ
jgi:lipopolysaccharide assembly outer membrane protein LptD (OstA)